MKTFTAKQFTRTPGKVFEAAREDGKAEITHDRFNGTFEVYHVPENIEQLKAGDVIEIAGQKLRVMPWKK